jgi:hypothetical protein
MLAPIRESVIGGDTVSGGLQKTVKAVLREFLTEAPLVSPAAARARNALTFMSNRLMAQDSDDTDRSDADGESSGLSTAADARVEALWRDLLIDWVHELLVADVSEAANFVETLIAAALRIRQIHESSPLPQAAKVLDRRAFANA